MKIISNWQHFQMNSSIVYFWNFQHLLWIKFFFFPKRAYLLIILLSLITVIFPCLLLLFLFLTKIKNCYFVFTTLYFFFKGRYTFSWPNHFLLAINFDVPWQFFLFLFSIFLFLRYSFFPGSLIFNICWVYLAIRNFFLWQF